MKSEMSKSDFYIDEILRALSPKKAVHVLSTVTMAEFLRTVFGLDGIDTKNAAILHDITREWPREKHIGFAKENGLELTESDLMSDGVLHSKTGAFIAKTKYLENDTVVNCIKYHTTGKENMSLEEKIVFLSDYIETTRGYDECIETRNKLFYEISIAASEEMKLSALDRAVYTSLNNTVNHLSAKGAFIHPDTLVARDYYKKDTK